MGRKRGVVLKTPDETRLDRKAQATSAPPEPEPPVMPELPPVVRVNPFTFGDFAQHRMVAETVVRMAKDAGVLGVQTTEAEALYIIMRGFEMGVPPFRALQTLYLAPTEDGGKELVEEASLMREQVAKSGLGVIEPLPEHCNNERATVRAIRVDRLGRRETLFKYTLDDAAADGLMLKRNWQSGANREALLIARATAKAKRAWFEDVEGATRYTGEELGGGGAPDDGRQAVHTSPPPPPSPAPAPVAPPAVAAADAAGATDAGGPHPPVAPPPGAAAAAPPPPPPPQEGPPPGASRQEKMAYYADVSRAMSRPWTVNAGMTRDAQPVAIITHGVKAEQITTILNYTVAGRTEFARADEALQLVIDHLGTLGIDTELIPPPYCHFALTEPEATQILQGLDAFARADASGDPPEPEPTTAEPPPNRLHEVQDGQTYSWMQANEFLEAVLRRLAYHATRGDVLAMMRQATNKEFYEMTPDELYGAAADLDRLGANPVILKQAIERMRIARGG